MVTNKQIVIRKSLESKEKPVFTLETIRPMSRRKWRNRDILDSAVQQELMALQFHSFSTLENFIKNTGFKMVDKAIKFDVTSLDVAKKKCRLCLKNPIRLSDVTMGIVLAKYDDGSILPMNLINFKNVYSRERVEEIDYRL